MVSINFTIISSEFLIYKVAIFTYVAYFCHKEEGILLLWNANNLQLQSIITYNIHCTDILMCHCGILTNIVNLFRVQLN